ncbi:MAG TPA: acyl-ACP desaturase, partial [Mycobacterium sp.]
MSKDLSDLQLLRELEPVVEKNINRHMTMRKDWNPHDYIPWSDGKNYYALGGKDWDPEESKLSEVAQVAMLTNLLTEDNLPYYTSLFSSFFDGESPMVRWSRLWTAEEGQHSIAMRSYLMTSRNCEPNSLEDDRLATVEAGWNGCFETVVDMF